MQNTNSSFHIDAQVERDHSFKLPINIWPLNQTEKTLKLHASYSSQLTNNLYT